MARGGKRGNPYRDASGRFASGPGQGGGLGAARKAARSTSGRKSTLQARTSLKSSRAKLGDKDPGDQRLSTTLSSRAQKAAVTRGNKGLKSAKVASQARISGGRKGVIGKPKGLKPGALAERRKAKPPKTALANPQSQNKGSKGKKRWLSNDQVIQANEARGSGVRRTAETMRSKLPKKTAASLGVNTLGGYIAKISGKPLSFNHANSVKDEIERITGVGRSKLQGVRTTFDNAKRTVTYSLTPIARRQAAIAEKVGSRKPVRRKPRS